VVKYAQTYKQRYTHKLKKISRTQKKKTQTGRGRKEEEEKEKGKEKEEREREHKKKERGGGEWVQGVRGAWVLRSVGPHPNIARST